MKSAMEYLDIARKLYLQKDCENALVEVNRALEQRKKYYSAYVLKGNILFEMDQDESALECYERAIELRPRYYEAYDFKASTLLMMGRAPQAEVFARKALTLIKKQKRTNKTNLALVYDTLASVLLHENKEKQAVSVLREGVRRTQFQSLELFFAQVQAKAKKRDKEPGS